MVRQLHATHNSYETFRCKIKVWLTSSEWRTKVKEGNQPQVMLRSSTTYRPKENPIPMWLVLTYNSQNISKSRFTNRPTAVNPKRHNRHMPMSKLIRPAHSALLYEGLCYTYSLFTFGTKTYPQEIKVKASKNPTVHSISSNNNHTWTHHLSNRAIDASMNQSLSPCWITSHYQLEDKDI